MARIAVLLLAVVLSCAACALASPTPFVSRTNNAGPPQRSDNQRHGEITGGIRRDKGYGTTVHAQGHGDAWRSQDGNSRVHVDGHYSQGVSGHAKGQRGYGGHVNFEHKF